MATIDYLVRFHQGIHARNPQHKKKIFHSKGRHFEYSCVKSLQQKAAWLWLHRCLNRLAPTSRHHSLYWPLPHDITLSIGPSLSTSLSLLAPPSLHHSRYNRIFICWVFYHYFHACEGEKAGLSWMGAMERWGINTADKMDNQTLRWPAGDQGRDWPGVLWGHISVYPLGRGDTMLWICYLSDHL